MDRFNGLDVPESLRDVLEPATLALVVYDMQVGILAQIARGHEVLHNVGRLLAAARQRRVRTVFMRHYFMPTELAGVFQLRQAKTWQGKGHAADTRPLISRGSSGFQLAEGLEPQSTEAVVVGEIQPAEQIPVVVVPTAADHMCAVDRERQNAEADERGSRLARVGS